MSKLGHSVLSKLDRKGRLEKNVISNVERKGLMKGVEEVLSQLKSQGRLDDVKKISVVEGTILKVERRGQDPIWVKVRGEPRTKRKLTLREESQRAKEIGEIAKITTEEAPIRLAADRKTGVHALSHVKGEKGREFLQYRPSELAEAMVFETISGVSDRLKRNIRWDEGIWGEIDFDELQVGQPLEKRFNAQANPLVKLNTWAKKNGTGKVDEALPGFRSTLKAEMDVWKRNKVKFRKVAPTILKGDTAKRVDKYFSHLRRLYRL